ncbi:MAG TPA: hypothetical protein VMP08_10570 [Anaerolineae bacterium]|nr:hypothetical protein [Anaerolineae bacterium]
MKRLPWSILIATFLTVAYLVGLTFNLTPWLRGPNEWRWAYAIPGTLSRLWPSAVLLSVYLVGAPWLVKRPPSRRTTVLVILAATVMTPLLQFALLYVDHPDVKAPLFYRTVSSLSGGYFNVGAEVTNISDFLHHFVELVPTFPLHPQTHPPGVPLLFAWGRLFFEQNPGLASSASAILRAYQCNNLPLMNLPNSAIASAVVQMSVPVLAGLVVWPLYYLGRSVFDRATALRAALLWPLLPTVALWATRWDPVYALFTVLALLAVHFALSRRKLIGFEIGGLIFSIGLFFTLGNIVIALFLGVYTLFWLWAHSDRPRFTWLLSGVLLFGAGALVWWVALWLIYGLDPIALWRTAVGIHLGLERSYSTWLVFDLYDFLVFMGIVIGVLWIARIGRAVREARAPQRAIDVLTFTSAAGLLLLDLSGTSRGEVARLWAFLLPLPLLSAVYHLSDRRLVFPAVIGLLAVQVFVSNIFLRTVGTGLADPPAPPPGAMMSSAPRAQWQDGMILNSIGFPGSIGRGESLNIAATWSAQQPIQKPYTIFIHLLDAQGRLIAQYDGMPVNAAWPTTCWQPQHAFSDQYRLTLPADITPGDYRLSLGFYWLPTLERVALKNESGLAGDQLEVGTITVR